MTQYFQRTYMSVLKKQIFSYDVATREKTRDKKLFLEKNSGNRVHRIALAYNAMRAPLRMMDPFCFIV